MNTANTRACERVTLDEGSVALPQGFDDRTTNLFVPADPQNEPNLGISRDWLTEGESLAAYVDRQLALLKRRLPGHKTLSRTAEQLGQGEATLTGERIDSHYRSGAQTVRQRQAVFLVAPKRALIFTATSPRNFDEQFEALWRSWLESFTHAATAG
jgi:hypothetical protein